MGKGLGAMMGGGIATALMASNPALAALGVSSGNRISSGINKFANKSGESFYRNRDAIDQTVDVAVAAAAVAATVLTGGAGAVAATALTAATAGATAYKATIGAYEGGLAGAIAGGVTGYLAGQAALGKLGGLNLDLSYSYAEGFGAGIGYGFGEGLSAGLSYNDREGFGVTGGFQLIEGLGLSAGVNQSGGYSGGFRVGNLGDSGRSSLNLGYRYSKFSGGTTSLSYTSVSNADHGFSTTGGLSFNADAGFGVTGGVGWTTDKRSNNFNFGVNRRGVTAGFSSQSLYESVPDDGWPGNPVPRNRGFFDIITGGAFRNDQDDIIGMVAPVDAGDEGPMGANELSQYSEGGALPDGVSTAKEFAHWQAADRAHHILISQNPEKYNNKATWQRIRSSLKAGVNYSDAEIRSLVAAEGGDAFDVNEDRVAVVKAGKWEAQRRHDHYTKLAQARAAQREYNAALATTLQFLPEGGNKAPAFIDSAANGYMNFMRDRFNDVASVADTVSDKLSEFGAVQYMQDKLANVYNGIEEVLVNDFAYSDADNIAERFAKGLIRGGGKSAQFLTEIAMDPAGKLGDVWDFMGNKAVTGLQGWWNSDMSLGDTMKYMDRLAQQGLEKGALTAADYGGRLVTGERAAMLGMAGVAGAMMGESLNPFHRGVKMLRAAKNSGLTNTQILSLTHPLKKFRESERIRATLLKGDSYSYQKRFGDGLLKADITLQKDTMILKNFYIQNFAEGSKNSVFLPAARDLLRLAKQYGIKDLNIPTVFAEEKLVQKYGAVMLDVKVPASRSGIRQAIGNLPGFIKDDHMNPNFLRDVYAELGLRSKVNIAKRLSPERRRLIFEGFLE